MTPLRVFLYTAQLLDQKPSDFWPPNERQKTLKNLTVAVEKLKKILEDKKLIDTHAYNQLKELEKTIPPTEFKEALFIQLLGGLVEIYKHSPANEKTNELIGILDAAVSRAKPKILEHHLSLEHLGQRAKKLSLVDQQKKDQETIQKIGIFYVLEYTLQALYEFSRISDENKLKLLKEGLKTEAGNLPAYRSLEDTMRKELCYNLFDSALRTELLAVFYKFEEVCYSDKLERIGAALQQFNIDVLRVFQKSGLKTYKGLVYAPFGNDIPLEEIIKKVGQIRL